MSRQKKDPLRELTEPERQELAQICRSQVAPAVEVALARSDAPDGQARWTAKLLANRAVESEVIESVSESTVRRILEKTR